MSENAPHPAIQLVALSVFTLLFVLIACVGFVGPRLYKGDLKLLHEWVLAGRRFGTVITWFLVGGDIFTAYTFIAVPALAFGLGAPAFFVVPFTMLVYPVLFLVYPRLWKVCFRQHYITAGDFVHGTSGDRYLALAISVTGILATLPYLALQLVGMQVVVGALGISGNGLTAHLPLLIAFTVLAVLTYTGGLRASASIAIVKGVLIYVTVFAAIIWVPLHLGVAHTGGFAHIFQLVQSSGKPLLLPVPGVRTTGVYSAYATVALGSSLALLLYPHALTGILSASGGGVIRRNAVLLSGYSFLLGLLALVGLFAIAAGVDTMPQYREGFSQFGNSFAVPALFLETFSPVFAGIAFAGIGLGALVPAAIMSIAAATLYTRNIHREFINREASDRQEARLTRWVSLIILGGAVAFVVLYLGHYAISLQLLGNVWILQTLPAVILGLYTRWFNSRALLIGWLIGMISGTTLFYVVEHGNDALDRALSAYELQLWGYTFPGYTAVYALLLNLLVASVLTLVLNGLAPPGGSREIRATDATAEVASAEVLSLRKDDMLSGGRTSEGRTPERF